MSLNDLKERFGNLSDREKIMSVALISVFCITVAAVAFALVQRKAGGLKSTISENHEVLAELREKKEDLKEQIMMKKKEEARFEKAPPHLLGILAKLAGEAGFEIPESRDLPDETIDKRWIHKSVEIRLRKIGLDTLVSFMVKIKNQNRYFPLAVTKMNIKKRSGEPNSFDVQLTVSSYRKKEKKTTKLKKKTGKEEEEEEEEEKPTKETPDTPKGKSKTGKMEIYGPES